MEHTPRSTYAVRLDHRRQWRAVTTGVVLALPAVALAAFAPPLTGTAAAQPAAQGRVTGIVTGAGGAPLAGVTVRALGTDSTATTTTEGRYSIGAPARGTLSFTLIGYRRLQVAVEGRSTVNVALERFTPTLEQVVVTSGYQGEGQRRSQVSGAVASVNLDATQKQTTSSVAQRLDAAVSGVTVNTSGSPGGRSTVRIRGISSFQNNDPLYIVDGTPIQDSYVNFLNPADIASITVLKDASAASIYGSRASNGVIVIETVKRGTQGPPRTQLSVRTGMQAPFRGYDDFLISNSLDYFQVVRQSYQNAGLPLPSDVTNLYGDPNNPSVPQYIWCGKNPPCTGTDAAAYAYPNNLIMPASAGTNWFDAVFGASPVADVNVNVSGAGTGTNYAVSANYFDQTGTAAYNRFRRGSVRANTGFTRGRFSIGENLSVIGEQAVGGVQGDAFGEAAGAGILGKNILSQPIVPVRDINGNFASGKAVGLGNNTNPLKSAWGDRNDATRTNRVFGNVYVGYAFTPQLAFRSTLGGNVGEQTRRDYAPPTPENSEPTFNDSFFENQDRFNDITWSNTLRYTLDRDRHDVSLLAGHESNRQNGRTLEGRLTNLVNNDVNSQFLTPALGTLGLPNSFGYQSALLSFFGQANYTFADRYTASFTLRRDGSSRLGPANQWGTFPAVGLAWRVSEESFLKNNRVISGLQLRAGYGVTGNQQIPAGRIGAQYGAETGGTFYDLNGTNTTLTTGYRQSALGNANLRWEEQKSVNAGFDLGLLDNRLSVIADVYNRLTDNLLLNPIIPGTVGTAAAPIINVASMRNRGIDFSVGYRAQSWNVTFNGSHYRNRITSIDGARQEFFSPLSTRLGNMVINRVDQPIGSFFGLVADGYFQTQAEIDALNAATRGRPNASPTATYQQGAAPGRIRFRDVNGDGQVSLADRTVIGNPHPDFTGGLDATVRRGRFDLSATLFGSVGNDIFDAQKNFYVFRDFSTNVRSDRLENSWRPDNPNAKYPRLDVNDTFSRQISSYYVEDGSYLRMRALQLGYTLPTSLTGNLRALQGARIYVLGENLFTFTGYTGLDPALPAPDLTAVNNSLDIRDQGRGVDAGVYPTSRTFSIGVTTSF